MWQLLDTGNGTVAAHGAVPDRQCGGCGQTGDHTVTAGPAGGFQVFHGAARVVYTRENYFFWVFVSYPDLLVELGPK